MISVQTGGRQQSLRASVLCAAAALCATSVLTGCVPDLGPKPALSQSQDYATARSFPASTSGWPQENWWEAYGDPQLNTLEAEALRGSPDLRQAQARVRVAYSRAETAHADLLPQLSGEASIQTLKQTQNQGFPAEIQSALPSGYHTQTRIAADLDWQLDFFGRNHAALAAAISDAQATGADLASARLQLTVAVATAYADLVRLYAGRDAAMDALNARKTTLQLVRRRWQNGMETRGEVSQQASFVPAAQGDIDLLDRQIAATRHRIAALTGAGPDRGLEIARPTMTVTRAFGLPPHLAVDLVGRRPDLVAARLRAEAASKRIEVAHADFYPNIDLQGFYGLQSLGTDTLFRYSSVIGALGPAIHLPVFSAGRLEGAYKGARAEYEAAVASYDGTMTNALREVADAITAERAVARQLSDARAQLASADDALDVARRRYRGGLSSYLGVLTAETSAINARRQLADLQGQALSLDIALVQALGGGFTAPNGDPGPNPRLATN